MTLVDKEKVIEAIEDTDWYHINKNGKLASGANSTDDIPLYKSDDIYKAVDSVKSTNAIPVEWIEDWLSDHSILWDTPSETHIRQILMDWKAKQENRMKDCRECVQWETCLCGKPGHEKGTSIGYSIGECKDYVERKTE